MEDKTKTDRQIISELLDWLASLMTAQDFRNMMRQLDLPTELWKH